MSDNDAPDVSYSNNGGGLASVVTSATPQMPTYDPSDEKQTDTDLSGPQPAGPTAGGSRLQAILSAVAKVGSTALAGTPSGPRPSFLGGAANGARAEQASQANDQAIKFKTFDDSLRAASLHNDDLRIQNQTQEENDAHQKMENDQRDYDDAHNIEYNVHPSVGASVLDTLAARSAANPQGASIAGGTYHSATGDTIHEPDGSEATNEGLTSKYQDLQKVLNLPGMQPGSNYVSGKSLDIMSHYLSGTDAAGNVLSKDALEGMLSGRDAQRAALVQSNVSPFALKTFDNLTDMYKAKLNDHQNFEATAQQKIAQAKAQGTADVANNPTNQAGKAAQAGLNAGAIANAQLPAKKALQDNAAANKPQPDKTELNAVAFDPNYQNPDGSTGANVVMSKADAAAQGLNHYKADPGKLNALVAGFNDVQNKLNMLATVVNDPKRYGAVVPGDAAALLTQKGIDLGASVGGGHFGIDTSRWNAAQYAAVAKGTNQATRDYVTAMVGAHEAVTQLPRLQTFGQSSRMTQQQMEAAVNLLPGPGDGPMGHSKMVSLQQMLDPLRKQVPRMPGAEQIPSWLEQTK